MPSLAKRCLWAGLGLLAVSSPSALAEWQLNLTPGVTGISHEVFTLHQHMLYWCVGIGVVVFGAMFYSMLMHRKSRGHKAANFHESTTIEIMWTVLPFFILIIMAIPATRVLVQMADTSHSDLTVKITGSRWKWHYEYLKYEGKTDVDLAYYSVLSTPENQYYRPIRAAGLFPSGLAKDLYRPDGDYPKQDKHYDLEVDRPLVIPTGIKVRLLITSDDVIHSWWVPDFGVKRDAIPGYVNAIWIEVPKGKEGLYRGQCAELCGKGHAFMPIVVDARPQAEFDSWLKTSLETQKKEQEAAANDVNKTFTKAELIKEGEKDYAARCSACHQVNGEGLPPTFPALKGSAIATGPVEQHIHRVKHGKGVMPAFGKILTPKEIAAIITYERNAWGNKPSDGVDVVQPRDVVNAP